MMTPQPPNAGPDYPGPDSRAEQAALDRGFVAAASVIRALLRHIDELDTAELPVVDGKVVRIVSLVEVEQWLEGCAVRTAAGEVL